MSRRRRLILFALLAVAAGAILALLVRNAQQRSLQFLATGKSLVGFLDSMAEAVGKGDLTQLGSFYGPGFRGRSLGLTSHQLAGRDDGVRILQFQKGGRIEGRHQAIDEWQRYWKDFESVRQVQMHVHRLEEWEGGQFWVASVRYELIGTLADHSQPSIDRAFFRFRFKPGDPPSLASAELIEGFRAVSQRPHFEEVASEAGVDFENRFYPAFLDTPLDFAMIRYGPGGMTATDYDNDGYYDLFVPDGVRSRLLRNQGDGSFQDVTSSSGLDGLDGVSVGIFFDFDNDGHKDAFISRTFQPNQLFRNNGDGTYSDVTAQSGLAEDCCTTVASAADYDSDGDLDLYVGRYLDPRKEIPTTFYARNGEPNQLYRNEGAGRFTNVTTEAGVGETGLCLGTVFGDYDEDGDPDLYVVNDFGRNTLYRNNNDGSFTDVTVESNTLAYGAGMNASMGDYDNDGLLDIYVTNIRSEYAWFAEPPTIHRYMINSFRQGVWLSDMPLYWEIFRQSGFDFVQVFQQMASGNNLLRNKGDGTFEDVSWQAGANPPGWFWGASFADFDNDGLQDVYAANGWVYNDPDTEIELDFLNNVVSRQDEYKTGIFFDPAHFGTTSWHGYERNRYLSNNGDGTFTELGTPTGTDLLLNSRGVAVADFWNRGVLDIAVAASTGRHALLRNQVGQKRNWLAVELVGTESNRDAVGARVKIEAQGRRQWREVVLGDGYGSQNTLRLYFGLNHARQADLLTVRWPVSGTYQSFENVAAGQIVRITEGRDDLMVRQYGGQEEMVQVKAGQQRDAGTIASTGVQR